MNARNWISGIGSTPGPRRTVAWLGGAFIAVLVATAAYDLVRGYRSTVREITRELDSQALVIAEQTGRSVQAVDLVLRHVSGEYQRGRLAALTAEQLHVYLRDLTVGLKQIDGLGMFDASGDAIAVSWPATRKPPNMAALPRFKALRDDANIGFAIFDASRGAGDGMWIVPFARRLETSAGAFAGVVAARGRVDYFQQVYRDANPDPSMRVALLHRNTTLLARHPPADHALGSKVPLLASLLAASGAGDEGSMGRGEAQALRTKSPIDGADHFGALRPVADYPLVVTVTRDAQVALAPWRALAIGSALRTLALAAAAALLLAVVLRQLGRMHTARASLEVLQERYRVAVDGANQGMWDWDLASDLLFLSPRAQLLTFASAGEGLRPRRDWMAITERHPDDVKAVRRAIAEHLRGATPIFEADYRMRHHSGEYRWYRQRGVTLRDANGRAHRMAGSIEDITERRAADAARARLEQQLRQAQKLEAIGTLAGGIAHDFNNILSAILGYGEMVQRASAQGSDQRRHIDAAMSAALRAKSLVERILAFSRSGVGERLLVPVRPVVDEALDSVAGALPAGVQLERVLGAAEVADAATLGDATQIHQVVMNLCANAVQAMKSSGTLTVTLDAAEFAAPRAVATSTLAAGRYVCLRVADTGSGIEPQWLDRIFDPFFTTKKVGVGTGLGLSLVHGIVTDLGGGIAIESELGKGTTFTVYLPWHQREHPGGQEGDADVAGARMPPLEPGAGQTVLLVDDEEALVRLHEETLAALGYEPVGFASAEEALEVFRAEPARFDAVLTDELMPGMTGTELIGELRRLRPTLPVLLMTGLVDAAVVDRARQAGAAGVLAKPLAAADMARGLAALFVREGRAERLVEGAS